MWVKDKAGVPHHPTFAMPRPVLAQPSVAIGRRHHAECNCHTIALRMHSSHPPALAALIGACSSR